MDPSFYFWRPSQHISTNSNTKVTMKTFSTNISHSGSSNLRLVTGSYFATKMLSKKRKATHTKSRGSIVSHLLLSSKPRDGSLFKGMSGVWCLFFVYSRLSLAETCPAHPPGGLLTDKGPRDGTFYRYSSFEIINLCPLPNKANIPTRISKVMHSYLETD